MLMLSTVVPPCLRSRSQRGDLLFRFDTKGQCYVYHLPSAQAGQTEPLQTFRLDKSDILAPHSNSAAFGTEFARPDDEFPLVYCNIYNNYAKEADPKWGLCCVYRIWREDGIFQSQLVQLIQIGFTDDIHLWRSENKPDDRPYGNFVVDRERQLLYAFTMRTEAQTTRYFAFPLPKMAEGTPDPICGVNKVVLTPGDIADQFDCPYHLFLQGACCHKGKIYSTEGFGVNVKAPSGLRIIDLQTHTQEAYIVLTEQGLEVEAEMIDFHGDTCIYGDNKGNLFALDL